MNCANCEREAAPRCTLCWRCLKYRKRNGALPTKTPRTYDPWATLMEAVKAWGDEQSDEAFDRRAKGGRCRVEERIAVAALRYAESVRRKRRPRQAAAR